MFQKKKSLVEFQAFQDVAGQFIEKDILHFPQTDNEILNQALDKIVQAYEVKQSKTNHQLSELDFLKNTLSIGYWNMEIEENDLYNFSNKMQMDPSFKEVLQYSAEEKENCHYATYIARIHPDDVHLLNDAIDEYISDCKEKRYYECYYRLHVPEGYRWMHHFGNIEQLEQQEKKLMNAFIHDVHNDFIREEEMKFSNIRYGLIHSILTEAPWDMVINGNTNEFFSANNQYWWSDQYRKILGFNDEKDFPNILESWTNLLHPEDFKQAQQDMIDYLSDFSDKSEYHSTFRMKNKEGVYSWFQSEGKALRDETGFPIRVAGTIRNIQEQKMKEQLAIELESKVVDLTQSIKEMVEGVTAINAQAQDVAHMQEESNQAALRLQEAANETKVVSDFIRGIADETNLLGLNASIEAARVGEQGKGFGVVAEHVRSLANNSKDATTTIEKSLQNMDNSIKQILEQMNQLSELVQSQAALTEQVNSAVEEINHMGESIVLFAKER